MGKNKENDKDSSKKDSVEKNEKIELSNEQELSNEVDEVLNELDFDTVTSEYLNELESTKEELEQTINDLKRERADFINFRNRVDRDKSLARENAISSLITALLPVLDDINSARDLGELTGPFENISNKLNNILLQYGVEKYGESGQVFDPQLHEALIMKQSSEQEEDQENTKKNTKENDNNTHKVQRVSQVLQYGYKLKDRVIRAARVSVEIS